MDIFLIFLPQETLRQHNTAIASIDHQPLLTEPIPVHLANDPKLALEAMLDERGLLLHHNALGLLHSLLVEGVRDQDLFRQAETYARRMVGCLGQRVTQGLLQVVGRTGVFGVVRGWGLVAVGQTVGCFLGLAVF